MQDSISSLWSPTSAFFCLPCSIAPDSFSPDSENQTPGGPLLLCRDDVGLTESPRGKCTSHQLPQRLCRFHGPDMVGERHVLSGSSIQLTNQLTDAANNAWYETPVNVQAFTTTFTFAETCPSDCGDGFGFMIISVNNPSSAGYTYSGDSGAQFSWSQCTGTGNTGCAAINSILVKFDLYDVADRFTWSEPYRILLGRNIPTASQPRNTTCPVPASTWRAATLCVPRSRITAQCSRKR